MKRLLTISKWFFIVLLGLTAVAAAAGAVYQGIAQARDLEAYPPPGQLVDVDGHKMHIHCMGQGSPTVIIEQGLGNPAVGWAEVNEAMARTTRVCTYDRAGLGYSEPVGRALSSPEVAARLNSLLGKAGINDDLVLVGWSAGGVYIREYYARYPEAVRGMVFVDSSHEQQRSRLPKPPGAPEGGGGNMMMSVLKYLAPLGVVRVSGMVEQRVNQAVTLPEDIKASFIAQMSQSHAIGALANESEGFMADLSQNKEPASLGDLPIVVLSQGKEPTIEEGMPAWLTLEFLREQRGVWSELQEELAALSTRGRRILATDSGHGIHADEPELLISSVAEMVDMVRAEARAGE